MKKIRPARTTGQTTRKVLTCGNIYITLGADDRGDLIEIFAHLGHAGSCAVANLEALTRAITLGLKYGVPAQEFADELCGIQCPGMTSFPDDEQAKSCGDAISGAIIDFVNRRQ